MKRYGNLYAKIYDMDNLNVISSYHGWLKWCDGFRLSQKYIDPLMRKEILRS